MSDDDSTIARLRQSLDYDPESGLFFWKIFQYRAKLGDVAGHIDRLGYVTIRCMGRKYYAHRLAWLFVHNRWPRNYLDHRDGNPANNRIENLREATQSQNMHNSRVQKNNRSGTKGVCFDQSRSMWLAYLDKRHLGRFHTQEEAIAAREHAARERHGEFYRK